MIDRNVAELVAIGRETMIDSLFEPILQVWRTGQVPQGFEGCYIYTGKITEKNAISLLSMPRKVLNWSCL